MIIGALKETKYQERRVAVTPDIVGKYKNLGFEIIIERGLGIQSGFNDDDYIKNGFKDVSGFEFISGIERGDFFVAKVKAGTEETYSVVTYVMIIKKEGDNWKFVSTPGKIMTLYNTTDVPIELLNTANNM